MRFSRRQFLYNTSVSLVAASIPAALARGDGIGAMIPCDIDAIPRAGDPALKELTTRALDAARSAGATYADVRYRFTQKEGWGFNGRYPSPFGEFTSGLGVRALRNGYWGYAALGGLVSGDDAARLGREAAAQATTGAKGKPRTVDLAPTPVVENGTWTTPVEIDPFTISWEEKLDVFDGVFDYIRTQPFDVVGGGSFNFAKEEQTFASSEGAFYSQTTHTVQERFNVQVGRDWMTERAGGRNADVVSMAGAGWEYVLNAPFEAHAERMIKQAEDSRRPYPADVGRYDIVFDAASLANLIVMNLGPATELDRAMTYTANTVGTSYLNDPLAMLGTYQLGSSLLNVTANRSMSGGVATVKWDDEGVEPDEAVLVKNGILTDFQTTRESASWLAPYYQKIGRAIRSHGGATCSDVTESPGQGSHNLVVSPAAQDVSFEALCSGVKKGLAVFGGWGRADQQALNVESRPELVYEITNGKLGRVIEGAVLLTRAPDFWKNLAALGGTQTVRQIGGTSGWPRPRSPHTVSTPAALVKNVAVTVNARRIA